MSLMAKLTQSWQGDSDAMRDAIIDNICGLISSRAPLWHEYTESETLRKTIAHLGVRNVTRSQSKANSDVILADISELIRAYEPRLSQVSVELNERSLRLNHLQFRISAMMHSDLGEESVVFDSFLDLSSNKLDVRKSNLV
ncbi:MULTISPECIES: type VI secretion system baseplate subunit TssE [Vibrio]|uniref:type VI secretion system baseplate subunit TssE n=1 Tax=Vibrio TaxID=662 RepID=UPI000878CCEA|nr:MULTISPECIES: type VI secretion system baseplate subunit TssE [Vibrio]AOW83537.1 type VI secretion protein [Vibrio mimicus]EGQ8174616.1 type VI secretion system baseplate subunit TssE [Vibrio vulnificus]ELC9581465.1 type VI secretion system baseplate subunit TssE [Vibrio vulnificus]ELI3522342.1 type VI secretion system baseplate subunit TssE [Vibrio vulnificus]ELK8601729.1 type VI secretion system baseplate subunit TssE [Vibrio vulnificus]